MLELLQAKATEDFEETKRSAKDEFDFYKLTDR
jgi:hypothetical protein